MTDLAFYPSVNAWWAQYAHRHIRIQRRFVATATSRYTARCGAFTAHGATLATAVKRCAMRAARPRCCEPVPF